ncbi:MAG: hypothetical protein JSV21_07775 [Nitrospirota bacterium]|nr:MAG: hypothetical protein JSV21_07775 [Nitrospirota bacterium]
MDKKIITPPKLISALLIILIALWFGINGLIYLQLNKDLQPRLTELVRPEPGKLNIRSSELESETLFFDGIKMKFPFYSEDIRSVTPEFVDNKLAGMVIKIRYFDRPAFIKFRVSDNRVKKIDDTMIDRVRINLLYGDDDYFEYAKASHYSDVDDHSWWDLLGNIRLLSRLKDRVGIVGKYGGAVRVYEVDTGHVEGISIEGQYDVEGEEGRASTDMTFVANGRKYSISFIGVGNEYIKFIRRLLSTIRVVDEREISEKAVKRKLMESGSRYPRELNLLSLVSISGISRPLLEDVKEELAARGYGSAAISAVEKEIKNLSD